MSQQFQTMETKVESLEKLVEKMQHKIEDLEKKNTVLENEIAIIKKANVEPPKLFNERFQHWFVAKTTGENIVSYTEWFCQQFKNMDAHVLHEYQDYMFFKVFIPKQKRKYPLNWWSCNEEVYDMHPRGFFKNKQFLLFKGKFTAIFTKTLDSWNHDNVKKVFVVHPEHDDKSMEMREGACGDTRHLWLTPNDITDDFYQGDQLVFCCRRF